MKTIARLGERGLLARIYKKFRRASPGVILGPGDDAAVLRLKPGRVLVATQDDLAEDTHFQLGWADFRRLAHKLFRANLSDLAAMGDVDPVGAIVSAGFPADAPEAWAAEFLEGLSEDSRAFATPVVGGNLTRSRKVFFSMTALGAARPSGIVRRAGARAGDLLAGVGQLGAAGEGLKALKRGDRSSRLARAFYEPAPQLRAGALLARRRLASSLIDNSDGLSRSAALLAEAAGLGWELDLSRAPVAGDPEAGEDYGLVFTVPPRRWAAMKAALPAAYPLGRMTRRKARVPAGGFDHFRRA